MTPFDWTFTPFGYRGTCRSDNMETLAGEWSPVQDLSSFREHYQILLSNTHEPILYFEDIPFYEDELSDSGISKLSVKIRVMPMCFLVLMSFSLDLMASLNTGLGMNRARSGELRLFHEFGSDFVYRESKGIFNSSSENDSKSSLWERLCLKDTVQR